jgi:hypothetical protein
MSEQTRERSLDQLARALASGSLSRGKALRLMGGLLLGGTLGSLPGVAWANDDDRCPEGQTRCGERCVNLQRNERHCGSCFNRCRSTQTCCNGRCVNLQKNENHCGSCFHRCEEGQECVEGVCGSTCVPTGSTCTADSECCSGICDGTCACKVSGSCSADSECCSGNCNSGTCSACPTGKVELSNGTCVTPCGPLCDPGPCGFFPCGCSCQRNFCTNVDIPSSGSCSSDIDCPVGTFCSDGRCFVTC